MNLTTFLSSLAGVPAANVEDATLDAERAVLEDRVTKAQEALSRFDQFCGALAGLRAGTLRDADGEDRWFFVSDFTVGRDAICTLRCVVVPEALAAPGDGPAQSARALSARYAFGVTVGTFDDVRRTPCPTCRRPVPVACNHGWHDESGAQWLRAMAVCVACRRAAMVFGAEWAWGLPCVLLPPAEPPRADAACHASP